MVNAIFSRPSEKYNPCLFLKNGSPARRDPPSEPRPVNTQMASTSSGMDIVQEEIRPLLDPQPSTSQAPPDFVITPSFTSSKRSSLLRQIFLGFVVALPSLPCGMSLAFSATSFEELNFTVDEASWFASVTYMAIPIGCLIVGELMDKYGRRPALILINVVNFVGWLVLAVPSSQPSVYKLIFGRILTGVAVGLASIPASVYAAECLCSADLRIRSSLVTWSTVALGGGIFAVFTSGSYLEYHDVASMATLFSIVALILVAIFIPESPVWLSMKGRHGDAEWSQKEINIVPPPHPIEQPSEVEDYPVLPKRYPTPPPRPETFKELLKPEVYKPLMIMIGFLFFQQFSGVYVMIAYVVDIIRASGVVTLSAYSVTAVGGGAILLVCLIASMIYPATGVRSVATFSGAGIFLTMYANGTFLMLRPYWAASAEWHFLHWVPIVLILTNIVVSTIGFLVLPWSMMAEVFPINVKGVAAGLATCIGYIFSFIVLKTYPYIQLGLGVSGVFFFFGTMALLGTIFVALFLPETKGKTLEEIVDGFSSRTKRKF
ncbi:facilitated trehalose transporter Tret1-like isoform X2 [Cimex lectularius]|uniref:Major facilitator superfamily (MFS) profile domain-containing protein n=1 Tax=Cimex lectularius TaxID=79782 RepID=A0A8I6RYR6_CIMLE|nr:facilitated trehalose transporter Tret1-like isoform X2 [Cimex lectularius]